MALLYIKKGQGHEKTLGLTYVFFGVLAMYATNYIRIIKVVNKKLKRNVKNIENRMKIVY